MEKSSVRARKLLIFRVFFIFYVRGVILVTTIGRRDPDLENLLCVYGCVSSGGKGKKAELRVLYLNGFVEKPARPLAAEGGGACGVWESRQRRYKHTDIGSLEPEKKRQT